MTGPLGQHASLADVLRAGLDERYAVDTLIGRGGAAAVFRARDRKHDRWVALKVLLPQIAFALSAERFAREIRLAARLMHPHIVPLLDSGEVSELPFYVMPYVEGESLRQMLTPHGTLPVETTVLLACEIADALHYAHAVGVVHRDVKPENVLIASGHALVADFGIAKAIDVATDPHLPETAALTEHGLQLGTPSYMSIEQAVGDDDLDGRSDIYSLGVMLFEMLTGTLPFGTGSARRVIARRFMEPVPSIRTSRPDLPVALDAVVQRAMAKDRVDRYATAADVVRALHVALGGADGSPFHTTPAPSAVVLPAGVAPLGTQTPRGTQASLPSIAVLPFVNVSDVPNDEYFADGLTDEVTTALARLRTLRVVARTSAFAFKGTSTDVREIGRLLGVSVVIEGSVRRAGNRVRVSARIVDASDGCQVGAVAFDRDFTDPFAVQDEVAQGIVEALPQAWPGGWPSVATARPASRTAAVDAEAYELYLRGRHAWNLRTEASVRTALGLLDDAVARDPMFAAAHAAVADAWIVLAVYGAEAPTEAMARAEAAALRAIALDPTLADPHAALGRVYALRDWAWAKAEHAFQRAIVLDAHASTACQWYATDVLVPNGRFAEATAMLERARVLDPLSLAIAVSIGLPAYYSRRGSDAIASFRLVVAMDSAFGIAHYFLGLALDMTGDHGAAIASLRTAADRTDGNPETIAALACALAAVGDAAQARALLATLREAHAHRWVSPCLTAQVHIALDEPALALDALERASESRATELVWLAVRPAYDALRGSPRFEALIRRLGFTFTTELIR